MRAARQLTGALVPLSLNRTGTLLRRHLAHFCSAVDTIGIVGVLLVLRYIPEVRDEETAPLDLSGFLLAGIGLASLTFGFESMGRGLLPGSLVIALLSTGAVCATLYVRHARKAANPISRF